MGRRFEKNIYQRRILSCMARKHMKRCLASSVNMKMQIKTKFLYHYMSMAKIKQTNQAPWKKSYDQPESESESHSVMSDSLWPRGLYSLWNSPGQNAGVGGLSLLQGIFPTQAFNPGLPHCRWILYQLSHQGSPRILEWVAYPFSSRSSNPEIKPGSPALQADSLPTELWGKINLDSILKSKDIALPTKVHLVKAMVFPVVMYGCESWIIKKAEGQRIDAFELWSWKRLSRVQGRSNLEDLCKEIQPVHPKGNQSWIFIGRTDAKAEAPILWPPDVKSWVIWKDPGAGKDWRWEEKGTTEDETVGWHHWLDGHEFEQAPGVVDGQGSLVYCSSWGHKESDTTEQLNWLNQAKSWWACGEAETLIYYWRECQMAQSLWERIWVF